MTPGTLDSLIERVHDAADSLHGLAQMKTDQADVDRLMAKRSGVLLALSYLTEEQRQMGMRST